MAIQAVLLEPAIADIDEIAQWYGRSAPEDSTITVLAVLHDRRDEAVINNRTF